MPLNQNESIEKHHLPGLEHQTLAGSRDGLKGLEVLIGIPAHVGGAIAMNAGTHDGATFDHLVALTLVNTDGEIEAWDRDRMRPGYRDGGIGDRIVLNATPEKRIEQRVVRAKGD